MAAPELVTVQASELAALHDKLDRLTALVEEQRHRTQALEELQHDLIPIVNHAIKLSIDELAEVGNEFKAEDLLLLLKRMLRNTSLIMKMMDQLEAASALADELQILGPQVFRTTVETLDQLERDGYFQMAQASWHIVEQIVKEFTEEDVRALGDNIVLILKTVRNMTQPEIMALANNAVNAIRDGDQAVDEKVSVLALAREMSDPKVRRGLARLLNLVRVLADEPAQPGVN